MLGNKCDEESKRVISTEKGQSLAKKCGCKFFETSAKNNINIEKSLMELTEAITSKMSNGLLRKKSLSMSSFLNNGTLPKRFGAICWSLVLDKHIKSRHTL